LGVAGGLETFLGMSFYTRFLSPENLPIVKDGLTHFVKTPKEPFSMTYRVRTATLGWRWVYGISVPIGDTLNGVKYTLTILRDVEDGFIKLLSDTSNGKQVGLLSSLKARRLLQLSQREKDVLLLMAEDLTAQQMADKLHITNDTVQYHRKQLKRKLKVKTSHGLVRYAIHLKDFMESF
jgi:DNA-binding CsgD family transcriptional regulator